MDAAERESIATRAVAKHDKDTRLRLMSLAEGTGTEALFAAALLRIWVKVEELLKEKV